MSTHQYCTLLTLAEQSNNPSAGKTFIFLTILLGKVVEIVSARVTVTFVAQSGS
jgi:hypothetical protein